LTKKSDASSEKKRVAFLGPESSFSHEAAQKIFDKAVFVPQKSIQEVFQAIELKKTEMGVVPIENSSGGSISATLDELVQGEYFINQELFLEVNQCFLSNSARSEVKKIYSHPQGFAQCKNWIAKNFPKVELAETTSTSKAAEIASKEKYAGAIASETSAKKFGINVIEKDITDLGENTTRFVSVSKKANAPEGKKKSSIIFGVKNAPGALFNALEAFKLFGINMTKIESKPSKKKNWEYLFFVEFEGNFAQNEVKKALEKIKENSVEIKILGSY